jgi:hypothetical protein
VIAYVNDFQLLMLLTFAALPLVWFLRAGAGPAPGGTAAADTDKCRFTAGLKLGRCRQGG